MVWFGPVSVRAAWGAPFDEFPETGWDKVMNLNVKSLFFLTKALAKPLRAAATAQKPGKVINIASIDGLSVNPLETYSYQASKAAVIHLTRRMAAKLIKDNINVTAICPGAFESDMNTAARDHGDAVAKAIPAKRIGTPVSRPSAVASDTSLCASSSAKAGLSNSCGRN